MQQKWTGRTKSMLARDDTYAKMNICQSMQTFPNLWTSRSYLPLYYGAFLDLWRFYEGSMHTLTFICSRPGWMEAGRRTKGSNPTILIAAQEPGTWFVAQVTEKHVGNCWHSWKKEKTRKRGKQEEMLKVVSLCRSSFEGQWGSHIFSSDMGEIALSRPLNHLILHRSNQLRIQMSPIAKSGGNSSLLIFYKPWQCINQRKAAFRSMPMCYLRFFPQHFLCQNKAFNPF